MRQLAFGASLLFVYLPHPFCWTFSLSTWNCVWLTCCVFSRCVQAGLRVNHGKVLFLRLTCHSELFCGQLSAVLCESILGSAKVELASLEVFSLTFQNLIENTFWGLRTRECLYTRIKERSYYIGSHLGKYWIIEKWNESVHRRSCSFERWHGRYRISKFSCWDGELENGSYSALIVSWGWIEKGGLHAVMCRADCPSSRAPTWVMHSPQSQLSDVLLVGWKPIWWVYPHRENLQTRHKTII